MRSSETKQQDTERARETIELPPGFRISVHVAREALLALAPQDCTVHIEKIHANGFVWHTVRFQTRLLYASAHC